MTWFAVDDSFHGHPKLADLEQGKHFAAAVALWTVAGSWCAYHLTDGFVPKAQLRKLVPFHPRHAASELVRVLLWDSIGDGFQFRDWADYQPSKEEVETRREKSAARTRKSRNRAKNKELVVSCNGVTNGVTNGVSNAIGNATGNALVTLSRPDPSPSLSYESDPRTPEPFGWSSIVETFSRLRSEAWFATRGVQGGRWKAGTKDHGGISSALELFREESNPQEALEDSIRGFLADPWCVERSWPFSVWSNDPGKYRGGARQPTDGGTPTKSILEALRGRHDEELLAAERCALKGDSDGKARHMAEAARLRAEWKRERAQSQAVAS